MTRYLKREEDGTALLSMETLANMPTPIRLMIEGELWDVMGWEAGREAIKLRRPRIKYRFVSESAGPDGTCMLEFVPVERDDEPHLMRRVTHQTRVRLETEGALDRDRTYTPEDIDELTT